MLKYKSFLHLSQIFLILYSIKFSYGLSKFDKKDLENLREEVRQMFQHAYDSYLDYAYPYDELRPLSCDGVDTWGSYSLTLIDALDTLAVMGNYTEFQRVVNIVTANANFDANINVSVFETNIRIIGGLLSAHLLSHRAGVAVVPGWPCNGPLLQLAEDVARRLIAAFDTPTGMPYGTVNLRHGVPEGETTVTCTAGVGTFILELGTLSRLTGDPLFEEVAMNALDALYHHRSPIGLVGNHIDVATGRWTAQDAGIGAGVDSYYEYLAKGAILLQRPELMHMFNQGKAAIEKYLKRDDWHLWVSMTKGQVTLPVFQSLEAYWPGVLSLVGDVSKGMKSLHNYHQVWKQYGFTPEFYYIPQSEVGINRESYPLRPELIESVMYLYRATGDPYLIEVGRDILRSIQHSAKTPCGYATIKDVRDHRKEDRMESFFLAETTKYLYLLFDPDNFIHNRGQTGTVVETPWGECILEAGGYIFNTEAHPIDPGALNCCSGPRQSDVQDALRETTDSKLYKGLPLSTLRKPKNTDSQQHSTESTDSTASINNDRLLSETQVDNDKRSVVPTQQTSKLSMKDDSDRGTDMNKVSRNIDSYLEKLIADLGGTIKIVSVTEVGEELTPKREDVNVELHNADTTYEKKDVNLKEGVSGGNKRMKDKNIPSSSFLDNDYEIEKFGFGNLQRIIKKQLSVLPSIENVIQENLDLIDKSSDLKKTIVQIDKRTNRDKKIIGFVRVSKENHNIDNANVGEYKEWEQTIDDKVTKEKQVKGEHKMKEIPKSNAHSTFKPHTFGRDKFEIANPDILEYRADDSDRVYPIRDQNFIDNSQSSVQQTNCVEDWSVQKTNNLPEFVKQYLLSTSSGKPKFDPQDLFERLLKDVKYEWNATWATDYEILSCPSQPFLQRLSLSGEMFDL